MQALLLRCGMNDGWGRGRGAYHGGRKLTAFVPDKGGKACAAHIQQIMPTAIFVDPFLWLRETGVGLRRR